MLVLWLWVEDLGWELFFGCHPKSGPSLSSGSYCQATRDTKQHTQPTPSHMVRAPPTPRLFVRRAPTSRARCRKCKCTIERHSAVLALVTYVTRSHTVLRYLHASAGHERCLEGVKEALASAHAEPNGLPGLKALRRSGAAVSPALTAEERRVLLDG